MWIADGWKDYELLDCGSGEKLERWGAQILVRPDPQAIWESERKHPGWRAANARYSRSNTGGTAAGNDHIIIKRISCLKLFHNIAPYCEICNFRLVRCAIMGFSPRPK
jgi:hypothetical protein